MGVIVYVSSVSRHFPSAVFGYSRAVPCPNVFNVPLPQWGRLCLAFLLQNTSTNSGGSSSHPGRPPPNLARGSAQVIISPNFWGGPSGGEVLTTDCPC